MKWHLIFIWRTWYSRYFLNNLDYTSNNMSYNDTTFLRIVLTVFCEMIQIAAKNHKKYTIQHVLVRFYIRHILYFTVDTLNAPLKVACASLKTSMIFLTNIYNDFTEKNYYEKPKRSDCKCIFLMIILV